MKQGIYKLSFGRELQGSEYESYVVFQGISNHSWTGVKENVANFSIGDEAGDMNPFHFNKQELTDLKNFLEHIINQM